MKPAILCLAIVFLSATRALAADTLVNLLGLIAEAAELKSPLVAEGKIDIDGIKGKSQDRVTIIERAAPDAKAPPQVLVSFADAKTRLLALAPDKLLLASGGKAASAKPDTAVPPSSFRTEDFLSFSTERCAAMRIADTADEHFTLVCEPKKTSQYSLLVYKFDREMSVARQVLIYKDAQTNLVRFLKLDDFEQVGASWRPKTVILRDFKLRTEDTLSLTWRAETSVPPEVFDATGFAGASLPAAKAP